MRRRFPILLATLLLSACEKQLSEAVDDGDTVLTFRISDSVMRSSVSGYVTKLNVQIFDTDGQKMFSQMKTQTSADPDFGLMAVSLSEGTYTVVAVGHSSVKSATIKSPTDVRFTASDGEKLTDTFCCVQAIEVTEEPSQYNMVLQRACAMVRFRLMDDDIPESFARLKIDYSGGSANVNPSTLEGITKSQQSETRQRSESQVYEVYTFPYLSDTGTLKMTVSALTADGSVIRSRQFDAIPVTRNMITTCKGIFFSDGDGNITQSSFGFTVNGQWEGEDTYEF